MRTTPVVVLLAAALATPLCAQEHAHAAEEKAPYPIQAAVHHPVSTKSAAAQKAFDEGLTYVYAFNHDEAINSFKAALKADPGLAMAWWGIALALGPNINLDVDPDREKAAFDAVTKATELARTAPAEEQAYVAALAKRYSIEPGADLRKLAVDYKKAMGELVREYPDDLDAATLYAESAMDLNPWKLWTADGKPAEGTEEIVAVLESVLRRDPEHLGANHYYIHAVEASPDPSRALRSAEKLKDIAPAAAGHLLHMPAHIYMRTGDYEGASEANERGARADREYIAATGGDNIYSMMYYNHNLTFLVAARSMEGRYADARKAVDEFQKGIDQIAMQMPMIEGYSIYSLALLARFNRWDEILAWPEPDAKLPTQVAFRHYARGLAFAARKNVKSALAEKNEFEKAALLVPPESALGLNPSSEVLRVAGKILDARIADARGDMEGAVRSFREAVAEEDKVPYDEPPTFYYPVRESLGGALLRAGQAREAEEVFRQDLEKNPRNGRSLFGLKQALAAQKKDYAASLVDREFQSAWKNADTVLTVDGL